MRIVVRGPCRIPAFSQPPELLLITMGKALLKSVVLLTLVFILGKQ